MTARYGHAWTSSFGEMDEGVWAHGLRDISWEQIEWGLELCDNREGDFPPGMPAFRLLCLSPMPTKPLPPSRQLTDQNGGTGTTEAGRKNRDAFLVAARAWGASGGNKNLADLYSKALKAENATGRVMA